ncbi:uncharacterized protein EI97DRAFT_431198 [Westerdykella ornata]|uniref:MADS-box domain-containing protein n=1 Tax=Westerdykella ornata TaxID=318751 RepID=A0A6A6JRF7_WESOR|nr:uncharacterized protein EI97DRAFT_431198 [Westerdykella ornata]KAF2278977.1 hypothetical protein EI97DRAFT_431198 [Westerdykella ornata]
MPRPPPRNKLRSFKDRANGLFKKGAELHHLDDLTEVHVIVQREGSNPLIFTSCEQGIGSCVSQEWVDAQCAIIKRPANFQSLSEGIEMGRALYVPADLLSQPSLGSSPSANSSLSMPRTPPQDLEDLLPRYDTPVNQTDTEEGLRPPLPVHTRQGTRSCTPTPLPPTAALGLLPSKRLSDSTVSPAKRQSYGF